MIQIKQITLNQVNLPEIKLAKEKKYTLDLMLVCISPLEVLFLSYI